MKIFQLFYLAIILLGIAFIVLRNGENYSNIETCPSERNVEMYPFRYEGVIVKKYWDRLDHGLPKIQIAKKKDTTTLSFTRLKAYNTPFDVRLWEYIAVGDTFVKPKDSYHVEIRRDTTTKIFAIDCLPTRPVR